MTLSDAIGQANLYAGAEISFDPAVFTTATTISPVALLNLTQTALNISITGPAASVTISGGNSHGVLQVAGGVTASLSGLTISGGSATYGGGLDADGTVTVTGCTFSGNSARVGGGIYTEGTATVTNSTLSANSAQYGAGLYVQGTPTITDCTLSVNTATYGGGAYFFEAGGTMTGCTLSANTATDGGGFLCSGSSTTMIDCTIAENSATSDGGGGYTNSAQTILASTISGNTAANGGGIYTNLSGTFAPGPLLLKDSIVAGNSAPTAGDVGGAVNLSSSSKNNLFGTGGSGGISNGTNGNIVGVANPKLTPLGDFGGPTLTMALLTGSSAIAAGTTVSGISTDQRGLAHRLAQPRHRRLPDESSGCQHHDRRCWLAPRRPELAPSRQAGECTGRDRVHYLQRQHRLCDAADHHPYGALLTLSDTTGTETITGTAAGLTISGGGTPASFKSIAASLPRFPG